MDHALDRVAVQVSVDGDPVAVGEAVEPAAGVKQGVIAKLVALGRRSRPLIKARGIARPVDGEIEGGPEAVRVELRQGGVEMGGQRVVIGQDDGGALALRPVHIRLRNQRILRRCPAASGQDNQQAHH